MRPPSKTRAVNVPGNTVGMQRHDLYAQALVHIKIAMAQGFHLEAITLVESLISDRLESHLSSTLESDYSFRTLGELIQQIERTETDEKLKNLVCIDLNAWRRLRNNALHGMVKIEEGSTETWEERISQLPQIAAEGRALFPKISKRIEFLRRAKAKETSPVKPKLKNDGKMVR